MTTIASDFRSAAVFSSAIVLPLLVLQSVNTTLTGQNAPSLIVLFTLLWLIPVALFMLARAFFRSVRARKVGATPVRSVLRAMLMLGLVLVWGSIVVDQLPCFLGIPNCD